MNNSIPTDFVLTNQTVLHSEHPFAVQLRKIIQHEMGSVDINTVDRFLTRVDRNYSSWKKDPNCGTNNIFDEHDCMIRDTGTTTVQDIYNYTRGQTNWFSDQNDWFPSNDSKLRNLCKELQDLNIDVSSQRP
jgi:hypothetical protein